MTTIDMCTPADLFAEALRGQPVEVVDDADRSRPLAVWRWSVIDDSDQALLDACTGPTLDVGCGPGRMTSGLARTGQVALGIDVVAEAVDQTRARGANALLRDVFDDVPGHGRWRTVLLADGNIGIGGDPLRLLRRVTDLLAVGGHAVVDLAAPGHHGGVRQCRLSIEGRVSHTFPWAVVGVDTIESLAEEAGLVLLRTEVYDGRWFAVLGKQA